MDIPEIVNYFCGRTYSLGDVPGKKNCFLTFYRISIPGQPDKLGARMNSDSRFSYATHVYITNNGVVQPTFHFIENDSVDGYDFTIECGTPKGSGMYYKCKNGELQGMDSIVYECIRDFVMMSLPPKNMNDANGMNAY
jgi:hypothetical protein